MTEEEKLKQVLGTLGLGEWQYFPRVGSTNDLALDWARKGAQDGSLVLAETQTAGRGRGDRRWVTQPGSALAMSLILRPLGEELTCIPRFTALAALGLIRALESLGLQAALKWPNDVLLEGKKAAGVLVEADWQGDNLEALVLGMGVNVSSDSVPEPEQLRYPATSVMDACGRPVDRWELLGEILGEIRTLRERLPSQDFLNRWNQALVFREERVSFRSTTGDGRGVRDIRVLGVGSDGALIYKNESGEEERALAGEILMAYNQNKD